MRRFPKGGTRTIVSNRAGSCAECGEHFPVGERIHYDFDAPPKKRARCLNCAPDTLENLPMASLTYQEAFRKLATATNTKGEFWDTETGESPKLFDGALRTAARNIAVTLGWTNRDYNAKGATPALKHILSFVSIGPDAARLAAAEAKNMLTYQDCQPSAPPRPLSERTVPPDPDSDDDDVEQPAATTAPVAAPVVAQDAPEDDDVDEAQAALEALKKALGTPKLNEARVIELIKAHAPKPEGHLVRIDLTRPDGSKVVVPAGLRHEIFDKVLRCVAAEVNLFLVGPAGSGKTTVAEQVAEALGVPFEFNGAITSKFELMGYKDAEGNYHPTAFRRAFENGGLYLADECDAWHPQPLLAINAALANGYCDFPDGMIRKHQGFRMIAAANTWGQGADREYVGRNQLDAASLDRFAFKAMPYDEKLETALSYDAAWARRVQRIRKAVFSTKTRMVVSPRATINGSKLIAAGFSTEEVEEMVIWKGAAPDIKSKVLSAVTY